MNTMVKAPPDTCPAAVCRRDAAAPAAKRFRYSQSGTYHTWVRGSVAIVLDCYFGTKSVAIDGEIVAIVLVSVTP